MSPRCCVLLLTMGLGCAGTSAPAAPVETGSAGAGVPAQARGDAAFPPPPAREPLAPATIAMLEGFETDIEVRLVFSNDLPPPWETVAEEVRAVAEQYARHANGHVRVSEASTDVRRSAIDGVPRVTRAVFEGRSQRRVEVFQGAVLRSEHGERVLATIDDANGFERQLVRHLRLLRHPPHPIGVVASTHREGDDPTLALGELLGHYRVRALALDGPIDPDLRAVILVEPAIGEHELRHLAAYLKGGGRVAVFGGGVSMDFSDPSAPTAAPGTRALAPLLEPWGVALGDRLVLDPQCGRIAHRVHGVGHLAVPYPPSPSIESVEAGPLRLIEGELAVPLTGSVVVSEAFARLGGQVWLRSSERSTEVALSTEDPLRLNGRIPDYPEGDELPADWPSDAAVIAEWPQGETPGSRPLLVVLEGALPLPFGEGRSEDTRVLVSGSGALLRPEFRPQPGPTTEQSGAVWIIRGLVDWLVGDGPELDPR